MENKINIAELLRNCPRGMELDCTMYDNACFEQINEKDNNYPIIINIGNSKTICLTKEGCWNKFPNAKCVIFPKRKTTWEGFHKPFTDGDILTTILGSIFIYRKIDVYNYCGSYTSLDIHDGFLSTYNSYLEDCSRLATEEEKQKLFQAIKDNGYRWNSKTKTLEELPKFKDGDVVVAEDSESQLFLLKEYLSKDSSSHDGHCYFGWDFQNNTLFEKGNWRFDRLATKEERAKLFQTIKDNGYYWDEKNKTLEKLPIFKVGNKIRHKENKDDVFKIDDIDLDNNLYCCGRNYIQISYQDKYELIPDKFDINTLKPFDKVLVRDFNSEVWEIDFFSRLLDGKHFKCIGSSYVQCIPYEGNEHLRNTTNSCDEYFKTWKDE